MAYTNPSTSDFKARFVRDFPYGTDASIAILDADIAVAFTAVDVRIPDTLFPDQATYTVAYLLLAAHCLVMNIRASSQGIVGQFNFNQASKGVGAVNEAFVVPERISANPEWAILAKTNYGAQYLELVIPLLAGPIFTVIGQTQP